ncbi:helix-turn-helix domain-containing protein [Zooshikella ganghwensis]|uniref:helix-turn-helix domain-containing protein n=1 Tax=Zooshikella ganghwensis TaxID=202772 RepID=UPI000409363B|nr:helix-turn-helix domain-containing protein [Zooshikella ganghwensis]
MANLWKKLRARRRELDLTQKEVADYCGVTVASVSQWEAKETDRQAFPRQDNIQKLSEILQVEPNWFYTGDNNQSPIISAIANLEEDDFIKVKAKVDSRQLSKLWTKLKARRKELDLTQGEIAKHCDVTTATVSKWEHKSIEGRAYPRRDKLEKLCEILKVDMLWLLDENDSKTNTSVAQLEPSSQTPTFLQEQMKVINTYTDLIAKNKLIPADLTILKALADYIENR